MNLEALMEFLAGDTVAIRGTATLEPAGGPGDKIFPPTHAVDKNNGSSGSRVGDLRGQISLEAA